MTHLQVSQRYQDISANQSAKAVELNDPSIHQLKLLNDESEWVASDISYRDKLVEVLSSDLDFHGYDTGYASHDFHPFPAKFPPQLPRKFIQGLTKPGDVVLDPMMGSGTTIVEAYLADRVAVGVDIDPLARLITHVKTTSVDAQIISEVGRSILESATLRIQNDPESLACELKTRWDKKTFEFIDYWFAFNTQLELLALSTEIKKIEEESIRAFFELVFSSCIITKSGGVSLAFDLAHTRPHRAKIVYSDTGALILGENEKENSSPRIKLLTKNLRSALVEFRKRYQQIAKSLVELNLNKPSPQVYQGDAQKLPCEDSSIDLIVTSPPYASNAIDYMRAHKFSLVWLGYSVELLGDTRKLCIGGEGTTDFEFECLPQYTDKIIKAIKQLDEKKGQVLHRYYSEMTRTLKEIHRVLKPDRAAILVVASSMLRNHDTETNVCLAEIGEQIGFKSQKLESVV
ncbi:MAG: DNA methyltransferase [Caldilineaceae bacterium]